jgi:gamma-glutamylcyclotransferase (GGCT)/AIG2-like uncharacterized protein YtfP
MRPSLDRLFVYGALVDSNRRHRLLGHEVEADPARLEGYARARRRYYFVAARAGAKVGGLILRGLSSRDFQILDEYEEVPSLYTRKRIVVSDRGGRAVECWIYLPTGWERGRRG